MDGLRQLWENFRTNYWSRWTSVEKMTFSSVGALILILLVVALPLSMMTGGETYQTLARNLSEEELQDVTEYLNRNQIDYQLAENNTAVLVRQEDLYGARYDIGSGIVLKGGQRGFEIFEEPRLGITDQYFKQQQIHALEVELEKTIRAGSPDIQAVFVHLNMPEERLFKSEESLSTASVKVIEKRPLEPENVQAIRELVAHAVDRLEADQVQVVNQNMKILEGIEEQDPMRKLTDAQQMIVHRIENELEENARAVLKPVVRHSVKVAADLKFLHRDTTKTTYDPESVVRSERLESETSTEAPAGAVPGTPANVPGANVLTNQQNTVTTREYEKIETNNEIGSIVETSQDRGYEIERLSVSVVVNGATDQLEALRDLVKNAVGYNAERDGPDGLTLVSIPFDTTEEEMIMAQAEQRRMTDLITAGVYAGVVVLVFVLMVLAVAYAYRKRLKIHQRMLEAEKELIREEEVMPEKREFSLTELGIPEVGDVSQLPEEEQRKLKLKEKVQEFAKDKPKEFASILRSWLNE